MEEKHSTVCTYHTALSLLISKIIIFYSGISEEEKVTLRKMLLTNLSEPVPRLATQVSVIIGRVARYIFFFLDILMIQIKETNTSSKEENIFLFVNE